MVVFDQNKVLLCQLSYLIEILVSFPLTPISVHCYVCCLDFHCFFLKKKSKWHVHHVLMRHELDLGPRCGPAEFSHHSL